MPTHISKLMTHFSLKLLTKQKVLLWARKEAGNNIESEIEILWYIFIRTLDIFGKCQNWLIYIHRCEQKAIDHSFQAPNVCN